MIHRRASRFFMAVAMLSAASTARADTKEQCVAAYDEAHDLREQLKLVQARDRLVACARDACPAALRRDCADALDQVTRDLPTVVVGARDREGNDLRSVSITVDGSRITGVESGRSVALDPGPHVVRFEAEGYGRAERNVVLRMGERNRDVVVTLEPEAARLAAAPPPQPRDTGGSGPWPWITGGIAIAGITGFAVFGIQGNGEKDYLKTRCAPACTDAQISGVRTPYILADVSLGIGVLAIAATAYLLIAAPRSAPPRSAQSFDRIIWK